MYDFLRRHYPHQVIGSKFVYFLSACKHKLPCNCYFIINPIILKIKPPLLSHLVKVVNITNYIFTAKSYARSISGLHVGGRLFQLSGCISLFIAGKISPWHLAEMAWPSPLVELLYNCCQNENRPAAGCSWAIDLYHMNTTDRFGIHGNNGHNRVQKVMKSTRKRRKAPLAHGTTFADPFGTIRRRFELCHSDHISTMVLIRNHRTFSFSATSYGTRLCGLLPLGQSVIVSIFGLCRAFFSLKMPNSPCPHTHNDTFLFGKVSLWEKSVIVPRKASLCEKGSTATRVWVL